MGLGQPHLGVELNDPKNVEMRLWIIGKEGCTGVRLCVSLRALRLYR